MKKHYKVINVGAHVNPPPEMWVEYFPDGLRDLAPVRVIHDFPGEGEFEALLLDGVPVRQMGVQVGLRRSDDGPLIDGRDSMFVTSMTDGPDGQRDGAARIGEQDQDGIDADVFVYPGYPILLPKCRETRWGMMYAFNNWLAEYCAAEPSRLIGIGEIPLWDIPRAIAEAQRIAKLGLKGVLMPVVPGYEGAWSCPADAPYSDPCYAPLWPVLEDLGLVMVAHVDAAAATPGLENYDYAAVNLLINKTLPQEMVASMLVSHVFRDHPGLKLVFVETGVGWLANFISWADVVYREHRWMYPGFEMLPSELIRQHVFASTLWDTIGMKNRDIIGVDNMMWCNDYPHSYGPFGHSREQIARDFDGVPTADREKILAGNAARVFGLQ